MNNKPSGSQPGNENPATNQPEVQALQARLERELSRQRLQEDHAIGRVSSLLSELEDVTGERDSLRAKLATAFLGWSEDSGSEDVVAALWDFTLSLQQAPSPLESSSEIFERLREDCELRGFGLYKHSATGEFTMVAGSRADQEQMTTFSLVDSCDHQKILDYCHSNTITSIELTELVNEQELLDSRTLEDLWVTFGLALTHDGNEYVVNSLSHGDQYRALREVVCVYAMAEMNYLLSGQARAEETVSEASRNSTFLATLSECMRDLEQIDHDSAEEILTAVLRRFVEIDDINALIWWEVNDEEQQYRRLFTYVDDEYASSRPIVPAAVFGSRPFLDRVRTEGTSWVIPDQPSPLNPSLLAVVPDGASGPRGFLQAARETTDDWDESLKLRLRTVANMIHAGLISLSQTNWLEAVIDHSSIPAVVRRQSDLRLVNCNTAFSELVGMDKDELLGTRPDHVLYPSLLEVPSDLRDASAWMFEEAEDQNADEGAPGICRVYRTKSGPPRFTLGFCNAPLESGEIINFVVDRTDSALELRAARIRTFKDSLTGLLNRYGFLDEIEKLRQDCHHLLMVVVDIDRFRQVNEDFNIELGNEVLRTVADRVQQTATEVAIKRQTRTGRIGPDSFAIAVEGPLPRHQAEKLSREIIDTIGKPIALTSQGQDPWGPTLEPSVSIGLVNVRVEDDLHTRLSQSSDAAKKAKQHGGRSFRWYEERLSTSSSARLSLETELRRAIHNDEFRMFLQPIVSMATGELLGAEALVRWQHPRDGLTSPGHFIDLAEQVGLAEEISRTVLINAAKECATWDGPYVSVNLAPRQLVPNEGTPAFVRNLLAETGLPPRCLKLEVTERSIIRDLAGARETLQNLRDFGVSILLDDFGTGYNAISYLRDLPVDGLKIDRSFVSGLSAADVHDGGSSSADAKFVQIITGIADAFSLECIAEGVETPDQVAALQRAGIDAAQGYLFHRPMNPKKFEELLSSSSAQNSAAS